MTCVVHNFYFSRWPIFCPFTALTTRKNKIKKNLDISSLYTFAVLEIWCTMDKQTDERTENVTYRGGCPT